MTEHSAKTIITLRVSAAITVSYSHWIGLMKRRMTRNKITSITQSVKVKMKKMMMTKMILITTITVIYMMTQVRLNYFFSFHMSNFSLSLWFFPFFF